MRKFAVVLVFLLLTHCSVFAARPNVVMICLGEGDSYAAAFAARVAEYEAEYAFIQEDDDPSGLLDAIRDGRVQVFGHGNLFG